MSDINTMTPDELRANLIDVCRVRDELYATLDGKAHELSNLRQSVNTLTAQLAQRDARNAKLERVLLELHREFIDLPGGIDEKFEDLYERFGALIPDWAVRKESRKTYPLPFEQVPAPVNPDAPAELEAGFASDLLVKKCKQCGREFTTYRDHVVFCSCDCSSLHFDTRGSRARKRQAND